MNKQSLGALVVLNVVLLTVLAVVSLTSETAEAQTRGRGEYVMIAGEAFQGQSRNAVYILEMKSFKLAVVMFDGRNKKFDALVGRQLLPDFEKKR